MKEQAFTPRADTTGADACLRWSHQSALVKDTIYIYGGQAKGSSGQASDTWNNNFLTLSLTSDWDAGSPPLKALSQPRGPPAVANGYLWHNNNNLYLYGGLFSDHPVTKPTAFSIWKYDIAAGEWSDITSNTAVSSDSGSRKIERAAEGAGISVPQQNKGYYFGGHLDAYTTEGWSLQTARVYLKSLLEFDMEKNVFRNITKHGLEKAGVPERADGVLLFVPWGSEGILVALGGGTNDTFSQLNIVDVYDISKSQWTKQATDGPTPKYRVNPCAAVASAADGSSHNIYFFGGQNLVPYAEQKQYDDFWILTIPSFTWIQIDTNRQNVPPARAGHSCQMYGGNMIVIGGYVGQELSCDSPGIYVFNASGASWTKGFAASTSKDNKGESNAVLAGPAEYKVPQVVIDVIGGDAYGGARVTKPARAPDQDSPIASGKPGDYKYTTISLRPTGAVATVTNADGSVTTSTSVSRSGGGGSGSTPNIGAIVGGAIGGIACLVILIFLGAYIWYRKKIRELREASAKLAESNGHSRRMSEAGLGENSGILSGMEGNESVTDLSGKEPSFWGVLMSPRRSLRVVNH
ncbi:hypothetical protein L873DRAFT_1673270 [Choiromyces venosus 120613-1]|uniref:Galactose oxidase n=1 Tax=Choiromyces venosus 120613-1 TaxID=1336337 RepID=A0A3N4JWS3_9PEZI|nr:hypothetical protein L873DRAFT_1673270 [Choiromyces venosus 120613-1]